MTTLRQRLARRDLLWLAICLLLTALVAAVILDGPRVLGCLAIAAFVVACLAVIVANYYRWQEHEACRPETPPCHSESPTEYKRTLDDVQRTRKLIEAQQAARLAVRAGWDWAFVSRVAMDAAESESKKQQGEQP